MPLPREAKSDQATVVKTKRGRPLDSEKGTTLSDLQPWKAEGLSRRTWYRRQREQREKAK